MARKQFISVAAVSFALICLLQPGRAEKSSGTVNIILANKNGLVAVTDSMLTYGNGTHRPDGVKLFEIDDRTICTMAGLYTTSGPAIGGPSEQNESTDPFFVDVPSLINYYKERTGKAKLTFAQKYRALREILSYDLTHSAQALEAGHPNAGLQEGPLELTIAGYDHDGRLKVAAFTLSPTKTGQGVEYVVGHLPSLNPSPGCEFASPETAKSPSSNSSSYEAPTAYTVSRKLACEVAGIPDVASAMLANPESFRKVPALKTYARKRAGGGDLSLRELRALALALEDQTAREEAKTGRLFVGGKAQVAVLHRGRLVEHPAPNSASPLMGKALHAPQVETTSVVCKPQVPSWYNYLVSLPDGSEQQVALTDCKARLDSIVFHDSTFIRGLLEYDGPGPLIFPDTNIVHETSLRLGHDVDSNKPDVQHLICQFRWTSVLWNKNEQSQLFSKPPDWVLVTPSCSPGR